jgi:hypothetical protein
MSHLRRSAAFPRRSQYFSESGEIAVQNAIVFMKKKSVGVCLAIMLRLHGVYSATACDLWAFVLRSMRFYYIFTAFLLRSKRFHCVFNALFPNDDRNEQQPFSYFFYQHLYHGSKER